MRWSLLWALIILVLTLMPGSDVPAWPWAEVVHLDKLVHAGLFGVQVILLGRALMSKFSVRTAFLVALLVAIAYGAAIELLQGAMGLGRYADVLDVVADAAGAGIAYAILRVRHSARA
jgi:VanZ family protein